MFKEQLKKYLALKGINQTELAEITGVKQQSINEFLKSKGKPQAKTKEKFFSKIKGLKEFCEKEEEKKFSKIDNDYINKITAEITENEEKYLNNKLFSNWIKLKLADHEIKILEKYAGIDKTKNKN